MDENEELTLPPISPEEAWARQTKYDASRCKDAFLFLSEGHNKTELAAYWGVTPKTVDGWRKLYPDFSDAYERGKVRSRARNISLLNRFITERMPGNIGALIFKMCNEDRENYSQRNEGTSVTINNNTLNLSSQERKEKIAQYLQRSSPALVHKDDSNDG